MWRDQTNIIGYPGIVRDSFQNKAFNVIDSLILSQFAYLHFDGLVPGLLADAKPISIGKIADEKNLDKLFHHVRDSDSNKRLFASLVNSPRFRDIKLNFYVNKVDAEKEKQFSALTYLLDDGTAYIAYRGTDSTFVGWKEDLNMTFTSPVPAQLAGVEYLNAVGEMTSCELKVGGHSKGGNIAIYSAIKCQQPIKNKISHVYSYDAPGFQEETFRDAEYSNMKARIFKYLPQSSVVGMLFQQQEDYTVVKSNRTWILQHDPFSWLVCGDDFRHLEAIKNSAMLFNQTLDEWISSLDDTKKELFVDTLFQVIYAADAETIYDLSGDWYRKAIAVLGAIKGIDNETRQFVLQTIGALFIMGVKNFRGN